MLVLIFFVINIWPPFDGDGVIYMVVLSIGNGRGNRYIMSYLLLVHPISDPVLQLILQRMLLTINNVCDVELIVVRVD